VNSAQISESNEWTYACSNGIKRQTIYPYGDMFVDGACNVGSGAPSEAGAYPECHGVEAGYSEIFDMGGNVAEYISDVDDFGNLGAIGASYSSQYNNGGSLNCTMTVGFNGASQGSNVVGFRCCANE
jgi:formylglycine-generating enzyme required for sulfatase activity